jgi:hypothetical protein
MAHPCAEGVTNFNRQLAVAIVATSLQEESLSDREPPAGLVLAERVVDMPLLRRSNELGRIVGTRDVEARRHPHQVRQ